MQQQSRSFHQGEDPVRTISLNYAGASPVSQSVLDTVHRHLLLEQQQGGYAAAATVKGQLSEVYSSVADLLHATSPKEIALVESATVAWTRIFYSVVSRLDQKLPPTQRKVILMSEAEYASNVVAACRVTQIRKCWTVHEIPSVRDQTGKSTGVIDTTELKAILEGRSSLLKPTDIAMVCITQIPTNSGIVNPVNEIGGIISAFNAKHRNGSVPPVFYLVDACQAVGQRDVNVQDMKCDALVGTGRKYIMGPRGTGFLYVRETNFVNEQQDPSDTLWPDHIDHVGCPVKCVPSMDSEGEADYSTPVEDLVDFEPLPSAARFEFYESNISAKLGLGVAIRSLLSAGLFQITETTLSRAKYLFACLSQMGDSVKLHHPPESGIVTFWAEGIDSSELYSSFWKSQPSHASDGLAVRFELSVVPATSTPLDSSRSRVPDLLRASVSFLTTVDEIDLFCHRLRQELNE